MKKRLLAQLALTLLLAVVPAVAQESAFFPIENVRPGMKGVGRTVFQGTAIETFDVEILGVLEKTGPQQNMILARLSGDKVNRSGVFAGMSGSPVYVDGKLLGAVAFAFSFATEPIAGITPIGEMVDIFREHPGAGLEFKQVGSRNPSTLYSPPELGAPHYSASQMAKSAGTTLGSQFAHGSLLPIGTPLNLAGFDPVAVNPFTGTLHAMGLQPVFGGAAPANDSWEDAPLEAGSTIAVQLVRGDMDVSASGTVTYISGNNVYAFGHPFMSVGYTSMPMTKAAVLGVIPSLMNSQKISATTKVIGSVRQDRSTGILGVQGSEARMIPVDLSLKTSRRENRNYKYEVIADSFLTPFLLTLTVNNSIIASERSLGDQTVRLKCTIELKGQPEITFQNNISDVMSSPALAAITAASPVHFLMNSGFENLVMERVGVELEAVEELKDLTLEKVWQDKLEVRAGEEVNLTVFLRSANGTIRSEKYPVKIPEGVPSGDLKIMVGDGVTVTRADAEMEAVEFIPRDLGQLVKAINNLKKNDRLYVRLYREEPGAVIAGEGLPGLPPSILALYKSKKTSGDAMPINRVVFVEHELPATDSVLTGRKVITVKVKG